MKYPICFLQTKQKTFHTLKTRILVLALYGVKHTQSRSMHPLQIPPPLPSSLSQTALACLPSLIHPRTAGKHKREENVQVDLQEHVRNLMWTRSLAVSHKNYNLKGSETNGSPVPNQHRISTLQAAATLDEALNRLM